MKPDDITTRKEFAAQLAKLRSASGLTYQEIAEEADTYGETLNSVTIANMVRGHAVPRAAKLKVFLKCMGVDDPEMLDAWMGARERVWADAVSEAYGTNQPPMRGVEKQLHDLRRDIARIEGMLMVITRELMNLEEK